MLKLLIADDEYLVLESLKMIVSKSIKDVNIVATASNGREAIEKALELKPDLVFMDIHMPGIDGMEAIRQIKASNSDIVFVILTAYEYFDYVKDAINLGVSEYLLKPINKNKVIETIENLSVKINQRRRALLREVELKDRINRITPFIEGQFISHQLSNAGRVRELEFYEELFNMSLRRGYAITALLNNPEGMNKEDNLKLSLDKQSFFDVFTMELKRLCPSLVGNPQLDRITAFIPVDVTSDGYEIRNKAIQISNKVIERLKIASSIDFKIGIGRKYEVDNFNKSCSEAYAAAALANKQSVMHFEDMDPTNSTLDTYPLHKESAFSNRILTGNIQGAKEIFKEIFVWLVNNHGDDMDQIKSKLINLLFTIEKSLPHKLNYFSSAKQTYILNVLKISDTDELERQFVSYLSDLAVEMADQKKSEIDGIIPKVLKYIKDNYDKNINLDDAAKSVNLSYHYFSKIFKDEMGKNFVDYLTEFRIEKSMEFLTKDSYSIKEVCHKIGYNDPNYYCKIFKKVTGMTPTEYRTTIQNKR